MSYLKTYNEKMIPNGVINSDSLGNYIKPESGIPKSDLSEEVQETLESVPQKQETLVSGENIRTINNESILGEGNIAITAQTYVIDNTPEADSNNLVKSSGVAREIVWDVTARNSNATFASLSALLSDANLATLIPTTIRRGGMQIRFVHSNDNKYVQYFLTKNEWSTSASDWEKMNLEEEVTEGTNFIEQGGTDTIGLNFGIIGANDGVVYPWSSGSEGLYSDAHSATPGQVFTMSNPNSHQISWHRAHFYMGSTYVRYVELGTTVNNYTAPEASDYDTIRFCFYSSSNFTTSDIVITTPKADILTPVKSVVESNTDRIEALEEDANNIEERVDTIDKGYKLADGLDITMSKSGAFKIENGNLYGTKSSTDPSVVMLFNEGINAIEFDVASLWDSNLFCLAFGVGEDGANNNKECYALCYMPTSSRPNDVGYIQNVDFDGSSPSEQSASIYGLGHFSGNYRQPQLKPEPVSIGDHCRIDLIDGFFLGRIFNTTDKCWRWWFCLDTKGTWFIPARYGWNTRKAIGFCIRFATITNKEMLSNIRIVDEDETSLHIASVLGKDFPTKKRWLAIGDSLTEINDNNGLSYLGYAQRSNGYDVINQGHGGWTIYKLWRDREDAGWESDVSALKSGDIVTLLAGTNDFDTATTTTPASDADMDAAGNPHPRFGTTDASSDDAKDPHTTLGCLRLIIERILTLNPSVRLYVFSPFYREKGALVGSTGWEKLYVNADGKTIYDYADAIYSVAREYNLPAFNTCRDCGINPLTLSTFTYDDLHIGQVGGELIGDYVAKRII